MYCVIVVEWMTKKVLVWAGCWYTLCIYCQSCILTGKMGTHFNNALLEYKKVVLCAHSTPFLGNTMRSHFSRRKKVYNLTPFTLCGREKEKEKKKTWSEKRGKRQSIVCTFVCVHIMEYNACVCAWLFLGEEKKETFCYWSIVSRILSCAKKGTQNVTDEREKKPCEERRSALRLPVKKKRMHTHNTTNICQEKKIVEMAAQHTSKSHQA